MYCSFIRNTFQYRHLGSFYIGASYLLFIQPWAVEVELLELVGLVELVDGL